MNLTPDVQVEGGKSNKSALDSKQASSKAPKTTRTLPSYKKKSIVGGVITDESLDKVQKDLSQKSTPTTLSDLFARVTTALSNQTRDIITHGGNPLELMKDEVKFFNKY